MNARTAGKLRRAVVLGGRAVCPAAMGLALASPGAAWAAGTAHAGTGDGHSGHSLRVVIAAPAEGSTFRVGVPVTLRADVGAQQPEHDAETLRWTVVRHAGELSETVAEGVGAESVFTPSDLLGSETSYEVRLCATRGRRSSRSASVTIVPETVKLTLRSEPAGAALTLGAATATSTQEYEQPIGRRIALAAASAYTPPGTGELVFDSWSDGGEREREYVIPEVATELVALYREPQIAVSPVAVRESAPRAPEPAHAPQMAIGAALRVRHHLPVISADTPARFATRSLAGWLHDARRGMRVEVAVRRGGSAAGCGWWVKRNAHFSRASRDACGKPRWLRTTVRRAAGGWRWKVALGGRLPRGRYAFAVRVLDARGFPVDVEHR